MGTTTRPSSSSRGPPASLRPSEEASRRDRFPAIASTLSERSRLLRIRIEQIERDVAGASASGAKLSSDAQSVIDSLVLSASLEVAQIESAFRRMRNNEYDCCMTCGATLDLQQLEFFPYAVNCGGCSRDFPLDYTQKLRQQHLQLRESFESLTRLMTSVTSGAAGRKPDPDWTAVHILLADLDRDLPEHFALEERDGYLATVISVAPRYFRTASHLQREHADFCHRLSRIVVESRELQGAAEPVPHRWKGLRSELQQLARDLLAHEAEENELISVALTRDLGQSG